MPTPSELQNERPQRSIFGNYPGPRSASASASASAAPPGDVISGGSTVTAGGRVAHEGAAESSQPPAPAGLQAAIDAAMARTFLYGFLARVFEDPAPESWAWLTSTATDRAFVRAVGSLGAESGPALAAAAETVSAVLRSATLDEFAAEHLACFGHTVRGDCPMNEIEYGDLKADPLFQPHRLADLGAFFAAFGLELAPDAGERIDHLSIQLEFLSVLFAREAHALEHQFEDDVLDTLRDAQRKFLREHLGRWTPAFARRLARLAGAMATPSVLGVVARFLGEFVRAECGRFGLRPGSEDLLLRPVDETGERLCAECGVHALPPGAALAGPQL